MKSLYFESDDILQIRVSDKAIVREVSQDWHTNISYAEDGSIVEIVLLDARKGVGDSKALQIDTKKCPAPKPSKSTSPPVTRAACASLK